MVKLKIIKNTIDENMKDEVVSIDVFLDGERIGCGNFGGDPEDNSFYRDYSWVLPLIKKLGEELGAEIEEETEALEYI